MIWEVSTFFTRESDFHLDCVPKRNIKWRDPWSREGSKDAAKQLNRAAQGVALNQRSL